MGTRNLAQTAYFMTIPEASQLVIQAGALGQGEKLYEELLCDNASCV